MELNTAKQVLVVLIINFLKAGILFKNTPKRYCNTPERKTYREKANFWKKNLVF
jgi:hypothetical protein